MSQRAMAKETVKTRAILAEVGEIELCWEVCAYDGTEETGRKVMRLINVGGIWTGKHGEKAGYRERPGCKLRGVETPSMIYAYRHTLGVCSRLSYHRQDIEFPAAFRPSSAATHIGLPRDPAGHDVGPSPSYVGR